jgi:hypothetical protein
MRTTPHAGSAFGSAGKLRATSDQLCLSGSLTVFVVFGLLFAAVRTLTEKVTYAAKRRRWSRGVNTACSWQRCRGETPLISLPLSLSLTQSCFCVCVVAAVALARRWTRKHSRSASPKTAAAKPLYGSAASPWASTPSTGSSMQTIVSTTVKEPSPNSPQMQPRPTAAQVARAQSGSPGSPMRRAFAPPVTASPCFALLLRRCDRDLLTL